MTRGCSISGVCAPFDVFHHERDPPLWCVRFPAGAGLDEGRLVGGRVQLGQVFLPGDGQRDVLEVLQGYRHLTAVKSTQCWSHLQSKTARIQYVPRMHAMQCGNRDLKCDQQHTGVQLSNSAAAIKYSGHRVFYTIFFTFVRAVIAPLPTHLSIMVSKLTVSLMLAPSVSLQWVLMAETFCIV